MLEENEVSIGTEPIDINDVGFDVEEREMGG
jgi:hypothetical protein